MKVALPLAPAATPAWRWINYATPVLAVAIGTVFLGEPITLRIVLGSALVLVGVAVAIQKSHPPSGASADPDP